jgi:hypothetical protein
MDTDTSTLLKVAYIRGLQQAAYDADPDFAKEANIFGRAAGWLLRRGGAAAKGTAKVTETAAKEGLGQRLGMMPWRAGREAGRFGKALLSFGKKRPGEGGSKLFHAMTLGGRQLPAEMLRYGTISGALGGLSGEGGWDWDAAGRGFLGGMASGAGWHYGGKAMKGVLGAGLKSKPFMGGGALGGFGARARSIMSIGQKGGKTIYDKGVGKTFGELWKKPHAVRGGRHVVDPSLSGAAGLGSSLKDIGIKTLTGVPLVAGMLGGSVLAEEGAQKALNARSPTSPTTPWLTPGAGALSPQSMQGRAGYGTHYGARYVR